MKLQNYIMISVISLIFTSQVQADSLTPIGWIERVKLNNADLTMTAKIDTGADNSSVHADNVRIFERDGIKMVRFEVTNKNGESKTLEKPLVRMANIKLKRNGDKPILRPVVSMDLCIGNMVKTAQVNLANRGHFKYRMLIGRSYLKDSYLVDANRKLTMQPTCTDNRTIAMRQAK